MKALFRIALVTTVATVLLIFIGGLVRVSGSGLGCPDWPRCYGGWWPPTSSLALQRAALPKGTLPQDVNLTLAWIEYLNRLFGVVVGMLMIALVVAAWRSKRRGMLPIAATCLTLTIANGGLGALVVNSELEPGLVSVHMFLALLIVSLLVYLLVRIAASAPIPLLPVGGWTWLRRSLLAVWALIFCQFLLGAGLREALEHLLRDFPLMSGQARLHEAGWLWPVHAGLGLAVAASIFAVAQVASARRDVPKPLVTALWAIFALTALQVVAGFSFDRIGIEPLVQVFHLWTGSMILAGVFLLYLCAALTAPGTLLRDALRPRSIGLFVGLNLFAAAAAAAVVATADASRRLPVLHELPKFSFTDQQGKTLTRDDIDGRFHVINLVFTHCPDLCPRMSGNFKRLYDRYENSDRLHLLSLSVDPERDPPEVLRDYAANFQVRDDRWRFLRGPLPEVRAFVEKGLLLGTEGLPEAHSIKFVLVDPKGQIRGYYNGLLDADLKRLQRDLEALAHVDNP